MMFDSPWRRAALAAGAAALVGMGVLTACGAKEDQGEKSPVAPSAGTTGPSATEKVITPGPHSGSGAGANNPTDRARTAPTALPGNVITGG